MARIPSIGTRVEECGQGLQGTEAGDKSSGDGVVDSQWAPAGMEVWPDHQRAVVSVWAQVSQGLVTDGERYFLG